MVHVSHMVTLVHVTIVTAIGSRYYSNCYNLVAQLRCMGTYHITPPYIVAALPYSMHLLMGLIQPSDIQHLNYQHT